MDESATVWKFEQSIQSCVTEAAMVVKDLIEQLKKQGWNEKDRFAVFMATEEALMNAVKHGNARDKSKSIQVEIRLHKNSFYAKIADEGSGFNPDDLPDPCEKSNLEKTTGRGVALIRSFVDDVSYNECGNVVEFRKARTT